MLVRNLQHGDRFIIDLGRYGRQEYKLIYANDCRAYVEPLKLLKRVQDPLDDERGGRINISPNTVCVPYDADLEEFMGTTAATAKKNNLPVRAAADRKFEAKKQERPVRENTIRAKLLAALLAGETNINKLTKTFEMSRSLLVAHVHEMWKCHGYGYSTVGDVIKVVPPVGGAIKAKPAPAAKAVAKKKAAAKKDPLDDDDDDFLTI